MSGADYEAVWGGLPTPAFVIDPDANIVSMNPAAEHLVGLSDKQVRAKPLKKFVGDGSRIVDVVGQAADRGQSVVQYDVECGWIDRTLRLWMLQANPLGKDGSVLLLLTPRGLAEKIDRSFGARSAARSITGMAAMLAHEIRNPLAGIAGAAQLLSMGASDADKELTELIEAETTRIGDLVNRVERFGDLGALDRQAVNIHDVLHRAVLSARAGFADHARLTEDYDPSLPPTSGDPDQLMQVFMNILKNASEATPPVGASILVKTAYRPGVRLTMPGGKAAGLPLEIMIVDNGRGIPPDLIEDIFDPFVSTKVNGSGLGLSLVSKVLADHGGAVDCESEEGRTAFFIRLPVWEEHSNSETGGAE